MAVPHVLHFVERICDKFLRILSILKLSACVNEGCEFKNYMSWFCTFFARTFPAVQSGLFRCRSCAFEQKETWEGLFPSTLQKLLLLLSFSLSFSSYWENDQEPQKSPPEMILPKLMFKRALSRHL